MLDLSGFESLTRNGLEQLCINAANERLQALCDACLIDREQQVCVCVCVCVCVRACACACAYVCERVFVLLLCCFAFS
jgi:hypothetical protein